jgi:condensin complex subunit 2
MPLKKSKCNKRLLSSDSDESINCETPKKSSTKRLNRKQEEEDEDLDEMVNKNVKLSNGRVNGISIETTTHVNNTSIDHGLNPRVDLDKNAVAMFFEKRKSLSSSHVPIATPINDNEEIEERKKRQHNRIVAQRRSFMSPANMTPGRRSAVGSTAVAMNGIQLREHYTHCIQLSASNKINTKNAFGLYLIDYMSELIKEKQSQSNGFVNFKLAGSTLDAGAKIYCHRVDSVHAEAQKVASSLVMALDSKSGTNNSEDMAQNNDNNELNDENNDQNNEEENHNKNKRKKTKRNVKTLAQNIETLNVAKIETNLEIDPVFHHLSSAFDMGNVNSLLMANLKRNPSGMLLLDSNSSMNFDSNQILPQTTMQSITNFYNQLEDISKTSSKICSKLSSFEFLNRDCGIDFIPREEDPSFTRRNSFTFDLNAEVEDVDDMDCEDMGADVFADGDDMNDDTGSDDGILQPPGTVQKSMLKAVNVVGDLVKMLSDKPNDYSYFNPKLMSTWAGPQHWKRCPNWQKKNRIEGEIKSKRQRKQYSEHDYNNNQFQNDICDKTGSSELKLKVQTLEKWQNNQNELQLPCDHGFDPKDLTSSFIKPETTFKCAKSNEEILDTTINSNNDSFGAANSPGMDRYDYDDDENDLNTAGFTDPLDLGQSAPVSLLNPTTGDTFPFVGDNLIEQEYELQQYNVTFAKFAKKMDVKKLKTAMWSCITTPTLPNTPLTSNVSL